MSYLHSHDRREDLCCGIPLGVSFCVDKMCHMILNAVVLSFIHWVPFYSVTFSTLFTTPWHLKDQDKCGRSASSWTTKLKVLCSLCNKKLSYHSNILMKGKHCLRVKHHHQAREWDNKAWMSLSLQDTKTTTCNKNCLSTFWWRLPKTCKDDVMAKFQKIVTIYQTSSTATERLNELQRQRGTSEPLKLVKDVATRWNSVYEMLERCTKLHKSVQGALTALERGLCVFLIKNCQG